MRELLDEFELRNTHRVFIDGSDYLVEQEDRRGQLHTTKVNQETVDYLHDALKGESVKAEEAADALEGAASALGLPYTYGHKLQFYAQSVLLVIAARGDAHVEKDGHGYLYTIT